jgi:hypothetical protein
LNRAIQQVNDYRTFFGANVLALEAKGWVGLDGNCGGCVVAGRRAEPRTVKNNQRLSRMTTAGVEIASYDRVVERCRSFQTLLNSQWKKTPVKANRASEVTSSGATRSIETQIANSLANTVSCATKSGRMARLPANRSRPATSMNFLQMMRTVEPVSGSA